MLSLIRLDFSPTTGILGLTVRLETLAVAGVVLFALALTGFLAGRVPDRGLRRDDLILIAFGAIPGAVVGGRLGYGLIHLDYYLAHPSVLFDPGRGSLELTLAVVLGTLAALAVAWLLQAPLESWLRLATAPLLIGLGFGKLAMALGGSGQGEFSAASWATAYVGEGPWGSLNPATGAVPSQILEGVAVLAGLVLLLLAAPAARLRLVPWRRVRRPALAPATEWWLLQGHRFFVVALVLWAAIRFAVVFTWRDASVLGPLRAEQLILVAVGATGVAILAAEASRRPRPVAEAAPPVEEPPPPGTSARRRSPRRAREYSRDTTVSEVQGADDQPRVEPAEPAAARPVRAQRRRRARPDAG